MKIGGIVQAVILLLLLATAASCEVSKAYVTRVFKTPEKKLTDSSKIRFMEMDTGNTSDKKEVAEVFMNTMKDSIETKPVLTENKTQEPVPESKGIRTKRQRQ